MPYEHDSSSVALLINMIATPIRRRLLSLHERSTVKPVRNTEWAPDWSSNSGSLPIGDKLGGILNEAVEQRESLSGVRTSQLAYMWSLPAPDDVIPELRGQYGTL
jgi:hypothetical protein